MTKIRVSVAARTATAFSAIAFLLSTFSTPAHAQAASSPTDQTTAATAVPTPAQVQTGSAGTSGSDVVKLSPFEVQASDKDIGYYSQNTLAGTRMNSKLEDIGASITVVTKQQMQDTSSVNLNDMFLYEASTEGTENYSAYAGFDKSGTVVDSIQSNPQTANRIRGLGNADITRDYFAIFNSQIQVDSYNIDSVEVSRGPNSTLFGIGSPSGVVNQTIEKAVLNKNTNEVSVRFGSFGNFRGSVNFNRSLIPDKLAIAVAGLYQNNLATDQKPAFDIQRREFAAMTLKPFPSLTVRANVEFYDNPNRRADAFTPKDEITPWLVNGSPQWDPVTYSATVNGVNTGPITNNQFVPAGLGTSIGNTSDGQPNFYIVQGQVQLWEQAQLGTNFGSILSGVTSFKGPLTPVSSSNPFGPIGFERILTTAGNYIKYSSTPGPVGQVTYPLFHEPSISNPALLNWQKINTISTNGGEDKVKIYNVEIEQQITDDLFLEAGWYREVYDSIQHNEFGQNVGPVAEVDPNIRLLNGAPNPYFGRPFVDEIQPDDFDSTSLNEQERIALAYQLDFTKNDNWTQWLGHHNMLAFYQHREEDTGSLRFRALVTDAHSWDTTTNLTGGNSGSSAVSGNIQRRFYLSNSGSSIQFDPGLFSSQAITFPVTWFNTSLGTTGLWTNEKATVSPTLFTASKSHQQITSYSYGLQDYLLKDRLVLTFGQRHDYNRVQNSGNGSNDPATGFLDIRNLNNFGNWTGDSGITRQAGGVLHITHWLSVHYNQSDNFAPSSFAEDLFGNFLPDPHGHGKDYGFAVSFFDDKLVAELNWYKSDASNSRTSTTFVDRSQREDTSFFIPWALQIATNTLGVGAGQAALNAFAAGIVKSPGNFPGSNFEGDTQSVAAKGVELNLIYNPMRNWNMKLTGTKDSAVNSQVEPHLLAWLAVRIPVWSAATDPILGPFWTTTNAGGINENGGSPQSFLLGTVFAGGLDTILAAQNHESQSLSKYHFSYITNYLFTSGRLKNFAVGGGLRWQSNYAVGYASTGPDSTAGGAVTSLSPTIAFYDKERLHMDAWVSYTTKLPFLDNRIKMKVQVNVRDLWESGRLSVQGTNPDGAPAVYRVVPPRQWFVTTTFDF